MSEESKDPSGEPVNDPADVAGNQVTDPADSDTVSRRAYQKALSEKRAAQARLQELEASEEQRKQEQLDKDGSLQEKIDFYRSKHEETQSQVTTLQNELTGERTKWTNARKLAACQDALPFSIPPKYYCHLKTDDILIDPESGTPDPASVQKAVEDFQKEHTAIVSSFAPKARSYNDYPANSSSSSLTVEEWQKLPYKEKMARKGELLTKI